MAKKVLIVDDASFMRKLLGDIISKNGFEIVGEGGNGQEGFDLYKKLKPDIVTLDITMPDVTGLECVKMIREFDPNANIVMCSAMGQQAMVIEAIQAGAKDFIVKPFQATRVIEALTKVANAS